MLPLFSLGEYPATDIDYGLYDLNEGARARAAADLLRQRIGDNGSLMITEEWYKLTSTLRYGRSVSNSVDNEADAKMDLSWVPLPVFLGLVEYLSPQLLTELSMSRKATHQAFASLWSRPLNGRLQEEYYRRLCKEHPPWAQKFFEELQAIPPQAVTTVPEINSKLSNNLNQLSGSRGRRSEFIEMVTGPSTPFVGDRTQSLREPAERFLLVMKEFPFAATLLQISTIWGGKALPRIMYARATSPRKRWNTQGEIEEIPLEPEMQFQVEETDAAIEYLCSLNLVTLDSNEDGYEKLSVDTSLQQYLGQELQNSEQLQTRALMLMCHLFPGDKELEPLQYQDLGRLQLRPFQCVVKYIPGLLENHILSTPQQHDVIATLLESSNFSDPSTGSTWKFEALRIADDMLLTTPDKSLEIYAAIQRKAGTIYEEQSSLLEHDTKLPKTPKINVLYWKLRLSRAHDCIHRDDFDGARREVSQYAPVNPTKPSILEGRFGQEVRFEHARFVYLAGNFSEAERLLDQELQAVNYDRGEMLYGSLISYLAGAYCELGKQAEAVRLTRSALTDTRDKEGHSRLCVSLAEALFHLGMTTCIFHPTQSMDESARTRFLEAKDICENVLHRYRSSPNFDMVSKHDKVAKVDRINFLRVSTIMARISLLEAIFGNRDISQALSDWVAVSEAIKMCGWDKPGFMEAISHLTIGAIEMCCGETAASERDVKVALTLLNKVGRRYLIVGLGVIWPQFTENLRVRNGGRPAVDLNAELVSIRIGSGRHEYKLPNALLCKQSEYFAAMLEGPFKEGEEQSTTLEEIDGVVTPRSFQMLVHTLLQQSLYLKGILAFEVLRLADQNPPLSLPILG
ncbi:hypothetical protein B7494_g2347 [Chlorociboria aeruginascens]|nr:hypothetical protein B7494_g2347 [Chlorociboria aeruginascens]